MTNYIKQADGQWRECNPYLKAKGALGYQTLEHNDFERTVKTYPSATAESLPVGSVRKGSVVWQYYGSDETGLNDTWISAYKSEYDTFTWDDWSKSHELEGLPTRQAVLLTEEQEEEMQTELKLTDNIRVGYATTTGYLNISQKNKTILFDETELKQLCIFLNQLNLSK